MKAAAPPRVHWRAQRDEVGHAFTGRDRLARPVCGIAGWDERYDHTHRTKCANCLVALEASTETEQRAAWGDR